MQGKDLKETAKQSNRYPFIAEHRGGPLTKEHHQKLIKWARECSEHVLYLIDKQIDERLLYALDVAKEWENNKVATGMAMKASLGAHAVARQSEDPGYKAVARSIGQTVATAHMADQKIRGITTCDKRNNSEFVENKGIRPKDLENISTRQKG